MAEIDPCAVPGELDRREIDEDNDPALAAAQHTRLPGPMAAQLDTAR